MRQPSADYNGHHRLSLATTCPYPSQAIVSAVQMTPMATPHLMLQVILMAPLQKSQQIHHAYKENHQQQGQVWTPTPQAVPPTSLQVHKMPTTLRKMPSHRHSRIPIGIRSLQDHSPLLTRPSVPASRTTKSSGKTIPNTGPSSPTTGCQHTNRQDTQSRVIFAH